MKISMRKGYSLLDGQFCWENWVKPGMSLAKVREMLRQQGKINPKTNNPPTEAAIEKSAYNYVIRGGPEVVATARKEFSHLRMTEDAEIVDDKYWGEFLLHIIKVCHHEFPHTVEKWIVRHGLQKFVS